MARKSRRGFASMSREKQREIASKGGKAVHAKGTAHEFTPQEARVAGRRGGKAVSADWRHMSRIGRRGGLASGRRRRQTGGGQDGGKGRASPRSQRRSPRTRPSRGANNRGR